MGSIRTCLLQYGILYGVNKDLSVTIWHFIWVNKDLSFTRKHVKWGSISTCLLQERTLDGYNKDLSVTRRHALLLFENWR